MRGVVSLAAALALPATTPERASLIFLTFLVILVTLVGQGLSLPLLIRTLGVAADGSGPAQQELRARRTVTEAALARIDQLAGQWPTHLPLINALRAQYDHRASHLGDPPAGADGETPADQELLEHHLIRRAVIDAERHAVLGLRERGEIDDAAWRDIERELDLEELRMDA
jgi:CPA1 family monovalent cation:H+ antiporter